VTTATPAAARPAARAASPVDPQWSPIPETLARPRVTRNCHVPRTEAALGDPSLMAVLSVATEFTKGSLLRKSDRPSDQADIGTETRRGSLFSCFTGHFSLLFSYQL
jgi:hypothetical protein